MISSSLIAYLMLEQTLDVLERDLTATGMLDRYGDVLGAMDYLWWTKLTETEHDIINEVSGELR